VSEEVWSARDCSPDAIEAALRQLLHLRYEQHEGYVPARVLNMVAIVDREWKGEIQNRLEGVGRYHASRTILVAVEPGRTTLDAWASLHSDVDISEPGQLALTHEDVEVDVGPTHVPNLSTIVDPLLVRDLITIVWSPHGHAEAVDALLGLTDVELLDSVEDLDVAGALGRVAELAAHAYIVDLAWLRSTPWRERIAATFDPPYARPALGQLSSVTVRHRADSTAAALMFVGWLASRLNWQPHALTRRNGAREGKLRARRGDVHVRLESSDDLSVPGLAGVTLETAHGYAVTLERGPGGLTAHRRTRDGSEQRWTVLGASRGERGILGEGVRQALLRDPTYRPALECARALLS
jgi:glucose-6-phosphate dehydrogenase assembly protein OpcA